MVRTSNDRIEQQTQYIGNVPCARAALVLALAAAFPVPDAGAQSLGITQLEVVPGGNAVSTTGVSGDGNVVVGGVTVSGVFKAFRWTAAGGMQNLGTLNGGSVSSANSASGDGSVIVGSSNDGAAGGAFRAFRWTQAGGMVSLGTLNGGANSFGGGVSRDGGVVVGSAADGAAAGATHAFRWTAAQGMVSLGALNGGSFSQAVGVSDDGSVVVGTASDGALGNATRAFRWTQAGGMASLGVLPGAQLSLASGVSGDGNVVVGTTRAPGDLNVAFRWTATSGIVSLGTLSPTPGFESEGIRVSRDGRVVVGSSDTTAGLRAFRWTQDTGMQSVEDWLRASGASVPVDMTSSATGVNDDGSVVVGNLTSGGGFIARGKSGLMTFEDLQTSLSGNTAAGPQVAGLSDTALHGAHGRPLAHRVQEGKSCVWTAGDIGRDDHGDRDGSFGLAEVGGCYRLARGLQSMLSLGYGSSRQKLPFEGKSDARTTYGVAELLGNVPDTKLWPSLALLYQKGDAEVRRGYLNAGVQDYSSGRPDVETTALRLRLDWEDAARLAGVGLTPYVDASYARSRIDAYTETGGGFPASFDARTEKSTQYRLGADAGYALSSAVKLVGRLEAVHRAEKESAPTSGAVLGLFSFQLPGAQTKRDWARAGLGFDAKLGPGTASAMLNGTTEGSDPSYWLNVSYQVAF